MHDLERFELTYQFPDWEPGADRFSAMEDRLELETAFCLSTGDNNTISAVNRTVVDVTFAISTYEHELSQGNVILAGISSVYCNDLLAQAMREKRTVSAVGSGGSRTALRPETLAKNWNIPLERVKQTLAITTQLGIRNRPTVLDIVKRERRRCDGLGPASSWATRYSEATKCVKNSEFKSSEIIVKSCSTVRER
jgi:hypothetical protein